MKRKNVVGVIIERDNKILFHQRAYQPAKGKLDFVGGYVNDGESPEHAAVREAKEETGYNVKLINKFIDQDYFDRQPKHYHLYIARIINGAEKKSMEGEPVWLKIKNITKDKLAFSHTLRFINKYLNYSKN